MSAPTDPVYDVILIGGGPAASTMASLLALDGRKVLVVERDIHPREHVGESLTPSTNVLFKRIGFLEKMEHAGFIHKPGAAWTAPRAPVGKYVGIRLNEFPAPDAVQPFTYNVERDDFDAMLLRHAHECGAKVLQGVRVQNVVFEEGRAVGVNVKVDDGWEREIRAKFVVDASGRNCVLASQLKLKSKDETFNQFAMYSWYKGVTPPPDETKGMLWLHFLGLERAWMWQIPLRNDIWSVGVVTDKVDFRKAGVDEDDFFQSMIDRNQSAMHYLNGAERIKPLRTAGDYSYVVEQLTGPGWMLIGDALRFVDPVFSTGVDIACYSALFSYEAISRVLDGEASEESEFTEYQRRVSEGVSAWYDVISMFYKLQNLFTYFAVKKNFRENVIRILQGNLYMPESIERAREMIILMENAYDRAMNNPNSLLRPGALTPGAKRPESVG